MSVTYLVMTSAVTCGMSPSGPMWAACTAAGTCRWGERAQGGLGRLHVVVAVQQDEQHLQHGVVPLLFGQRRQTGVEAVHPLPEVVDPFDRVAGLDQPVHVLVDADAVIVRVHHVDR